MGDCEQVEAADTNLQEFFEHVFDRLGQVVEPLGCDTAFYLSKLEDAEMSEDDKVELVHTLWRMMDSVIRMQFGFDSLTHIMNEKAQIRAHNDLAMVHSSPINRTENEGA